MTKKELRQKALNTIKESQKIINQYLLGEIELSEDIRRAFAKYNSAMRTRYFTSDDVSIEQKRQYHRNKVSTMRLIGLHRMPL